MRFKNSQIGNTWIGLVCAELVGLAALAVNAIT
jgi:hypothetical protein